MKQFYFNTYTKAPVLFVTLLLLSYCSRGQAPVAAFTANITSGCAPLTVSFTDQSTGNPFSWSWDLGNGQLSNIRNPIATYSQPGTYTVTLIVRNTAGIDDEIKTNYITVSPSPVVAFTANITTACAPATIQFTDQSAVPPGGGTIVSWLWDFGDGATSTQQNPSHVFTSTGFYNISLQVISSTGCRGFGSIGRMIRIVSGIAADFNFTPPGTCRPPFLVNFQDQSSGPGTLSYLWNFGNGGPTSTLQNPNSVYATAGSYTVRLDVQSSLGCNGFIEKIITISGTTTDFTPPAAICVGQAVNFTNNSSPSPLSSLWDFGDGTISSQINPSKTYLTGGTFPVKLINNYGSCSDSITKTVTVVSQPAVNFAANDSTSCRTPFAVQFTDLSPGASTWLWDFGDGTTSTQQNPNHTYNTQGDFNVTLTITIAGGCSNTITKSQYIKIKPTTVAIANAPAGGCVPFTYSPIPGIQTVDSIATYSWDLGEPGAIYNTQFPSYTYNTPGNYTIRLTVTTQSGCTETITIPNGVRVGTLPAVNFSFTPNNTCASTPVQFTDLSITTPGAFVGWDWDFGDGDFSNLQNPLHIFKDTGAVTVTLIVSNNGCRDSASRALQVLPPVADFRYVTNCNNRLQVTFIDTSLANPIYGPITYEWRMGDPANTIFFGLPAPTFTYPAFGTYSATLIVTNGPCSYQVTKPVIITNELADFSMSKNPVCKSERFTLSAINSNPNNISSYTWTIGGTTFTDTARTIDFSFPAYGTYDVTLTIVDTNNCISTKTVTNFITVSGPVAGFTANGPGSCSNKLITFTDQSTPAGTITNWNWNFGDGNQQSYTSPPFTHTYTQPGGYTVSLIVRDNANCTDTFSLPVPLLITSPRAGFRGDTIYCPGTPLQFSDTSFGVGLAYTWSFGDGGTSNLQNPLHSYPAGDNNYTVKLKIRDLAGCEDSITKTSYIKIRKPKPAFDIRDTAAICTPLLTSFTFRGTDYQSFFWDFGDGGTTSLQNPTHFYNSFGTFTPKLYLVGPGGCIDSAEARVNIYDPALTIQINYNPNTACNSLTVNFNFTTPPGFKFYFHFGDGTIDSSQQKSLTHFYASPGTYFPFVALFDPLGCNAAVNTATPISVFGAIPLFDKNRKEFCDQGEVFFTNYTLFNDPVISSVYDFGDGSTSTARDPSHIFTAPGTYIVRLNVVTQNQCTSSFQDTIRVYRTPVLTINGRDTLCINIAEQFQGVLAQPDTLTNWQWNLGNGSTSQQQNPSVTFTNTGNYNLQLIAANKLGCADTANHPVYVSPLPTAVPLANPVTIISGGSAVLNMNYTGNIISYNWTPPQRLDCVNCPAPEANPQFTTKYNVQVQDRYGCINNGDITVQVVCTGQNFFVPNTFSPNGDGTNDVFYLRGNGLFRVKSMRIFSRWGEVVFERREFPVNNPAFGWNGIYKGKKPVADVYIYQLEIICENGELIKYAGNIALIQ